MKCPHCNGEHPDDFKFCPETGKKIELKACTNEKCSEFGKKVLPPDAMFCPKCGKAIDDNHRNPFDAVTNGYDYVDLDLPSGNLWAMCNLMAEKPENAGNFYQFGKIEGHNHNGNGNFMFNLWEYDDPELPSDSLLLPLSLDAAHAIMEGNWHIPSCADFEELQKCCNWQWMDNYHETGVGGYVVSGKNSHVIFFPYVGSYGSTSNTSLDENLHPRFSDEDTRYRCADYCHYKNRILSYFFCLREKEKSYCTSCLGSSYSGYVIRAVCNIK